MRTVHDDAQRQLNHAAARIGLHPRAVVAAGTPSALSEFALRVALRQREPQTVRAWYVVHDTSGGNAMGPIIPLPGATAQSALAAATHAATVHALHGLPLPGASGVIDIDLHQHSDEVIARVIRAFVRKLLEHLEIIREGLLPTPDWLAFAPLSFDPAAIAADEYLAGFARLHPQRMTQPGSPGIRLLTHAHPTRTPFLDSQRATAGTDDPRHPSLRFLNDIETSSVLRGTAPALGVAACAEHALSLLHDTHIVGASIALHGLTDYGAAIARELIDRGALVTAIADLDHAPFALVEESGFCKSDITRMVEGRHTTGSIRRREHTTISWSEFWSRETDALIQCVPVGELCDFAKNSVHAKLVVETATGPIPPAAEQALTARGIPIIPALLSGCGAVHAHGPRTTLHNIRARIQETLAEVLEATSMYGCSLRSACYCLAATDLVLSAPRRVTGTPPS